LTLLPRNVSEFKKESNAFVYWTPFRDGAGGKSRQNETIPCKTRKNKLKLFQKNQPFLPEIAKKSENRQKRLANGKRFRYNWI